MSPISRRQFLERSRRARRRGGRVGGWKLFDAAGDEHAWGREHERISGLDIGTARARRARSCW